MQLYRPGNVVAERYEIKEVLGQGQVGATYLAFDKELETDVALKILAAELLSSDALRDFDAIFEKVSNLSHRHLRKIYEYEAQAQGSLALYTGVYHQGESLRQMLQGRKVFTHLEAEPILSQICQALTAAEKICAHGALRPENILVLPDSVKVTDLGIAAALGSTYIATLRKGGASRYLAPELKNGGAITPRADVYSLGVLFSEMLSGEPYDGSPISFSAKNASLPPSLDDVAKIALAANPAERYANANEFAEDLASVIDTGKIKPRSMPTSGNAIPTHSSLPVLTSAGAVAAPVVAATAAAAPVIAAAPEVVSPIHEEPLAVPDEAIELSVIAAPKVAEVSRVETVIPPPPKEVGDNDQTVVRSTASVVGLKALNADTRAPSKDPTDDLFGSALQEVPKPRPPDQRPRPSATPPPMVPQPPVVSHHTQNGAAYAHLSTSQSTALARASDLPPPVMAPPTQGAVVMPGWALGMFGFLLLGLFGVVIFLLVKQPQQPVYVPNPVAVTPNNTVLVNNVPDPKPDPLPLIPDTKPAPAASTQTAPATSMVTSNVSSFPTSAVAVNTTNPVNDPKNPGTDPKNPVVDPKNPGEDPKNPVVDPKNPGDPKNPVVDPKNPKNPAIDPKNPVDPTAVPKTGTCPGGMAKLTIGKDKKEYCIDRYEYPGKGSVPQTGVDLGTAEATCQAKGKRLCTSEEWGRGCGGNYPYGKDFDANACNTKDADDNPRSVAAAGSFAKCKSGGIYDMSGNVEEWVQGGSKRGGSAKSGDTFATCSKSTKGGASEFTGFRCCADPTIK